MWSKQTVLSQSPTQGSHFTLVMIPVLQPAFSGILLYPSLFKNKTSLCWMWLGEWVTDWSQLSHPPLFPLLRIISSYLIHLPFLQGFGERVPKVPTWNSPMQPVFPFLFLESLHIPQQWHNSHEELSTCLSVSPINASLLRTTEGLRGSCLRPHRNSKAELPQDPWGVFLDALPHYNLMLTFEQCPPFCTLVLFYPNTQASKMMWLSFWIKNGTAQMLDGCMPAISFSVKGIVSLTCFPSPGHFSPLDLHPHITYSMNRI